MSSAFALNRHYDASLMYLVVSELNRCRAVIGYAGKILVYHAKPGGDVQAYISVPHDLAVPGTSGPLDCLQVVHAPCLLCGSFSAVGN